MKMELRQIADRYEKEMEEAWKRGFDEGYASADDWMIEHEDEMQEHGWVRERTCKAERKDGERGLYCSECGALIEDRYCSHCGAKVVE